MGESKGDSRTRLHPDCYVCVYRYTKTTSITEDAKSCFQSDDWYHHSSNSKVFINLHDTAKPTYRYVSSILTIVAGTEGKQFFPVTSCIVMKYYLLLCKLLASPTISFSPKLAPNFILLFLPRTLQELIALQHCFSLKTVHQLTRWSHTVFCTVLCLRKLNKQKLLISSTVHVQSINHTVLPTTHCCDENSISVLLLYFFTWFVNKCNKWKVSEPLEHLTHWIYLIHRYYIITTNHKQYAKNIRLYHSYWNGKLKHKQICYNL